MKGGGHGGSGGPPPLRLPLPSGSFLDHLPPAQKRARFNLLLLEHGEVYLGESRWVGWVVGSMSSVHVPACMRVC